MKTKFLTTILLAVSFSSVASDRDEKHVLKKTIDSNPFSENYELQRVSTIEPKGALIFPFSETKNQITLLEPDRGYVEQARETLINGFAEVAKVRDFSEVVKGYADYDREFRAKFHSQFHMAEQLSKSNSVSANSGYAFTLNPLSDFIDKGAVLILESPNGDFYPGKGWDSVTRILKHPRLGSLIISEWDFTLSNGGSMIDQDAINFAVNGHPAIFIVRQGRNGESESSLSWVDDKKSYSIQTNVNVNQQGLLSEFKRLSEALSRP